MRNVIYLRSIKNVEYNDKKMLFGYIPENATIFPN